MTDVERAKWAHRTPALLVILDDLEQPVVYEDGAAMAEGRGPLLFYADMMLLTVAHNQRVCFANRLIDQAQMPFDRLVIHFDHERAEEGVEIVFDEVLFDFADFNGKFHRCYSSECEVAYAVPYAKAA